MKEYFECNLPVQAPYWLHASISNDFQQMLNSIHARMNLLNEAHRITGIDGARFSKQAKILFDNRSDFDTMSADDVAQFVTLMDDGMPVAQRLEWPNATVIVDTDFVSRHEWESLRHFGIGGSEAAIVLGVSPYQTGTSLYHGKVGTPAKVADADSKWVFDRGHEMEDRVVEAFCNTTGAKRVPETRMFASKRYPNCTANIDAIVQFSDGRLFVFEAKSTIAENFMAWTAGRIPGHYVPQTRQYPAVLDDDRIQGTYIGCLFTDDIVSNGVYIDSKYDVKEMKVAFVEREKGTEEEQLQLESEWFSDYVEINQEPPRTGLAVNPGHPSGSELEVLKKYTLGLADKSAPVQIWSKDEFGDAAEEWLRLKEQQKVLKKQADDIDEAAKETSLDMIAELGSAVEAHIELDDGWYYEVKNSPRSRTSVNVDQLRDLIDTIRPHLPQELAAKFDSVIVDEPESSRVFSIKKKQAKTKKNKGIVI